MKKLLSFIVMTLMGMSLMAKPVDPTVAVRVAQNFAATQVKMVDNTAKIVYTHPMPESGQPAMYVVNVGPSAFVIVAANDIAHPVLGYSMARPWPVLNGERRSENGEPNTTEGSERASLENGERAAAVQLPSQVSSFLDDLASQIRAAQQQDIAQDRETATEWHRLLSSEYNLYNSQLDLPDSVGPLLTTTWDQGQYYNALCPEDANGPAGHVWTGCVATAMAQIINYWGYPVHGRGSHSYNHFNYGTLTINYDSATYDYANMPSVLTATSTPQQVNAVAQLMHDCGVAANMMYGPTESSSYDVDARAGMINFFRISPNASYAEKAYFANDEWNDMLRTDLGNSRVVMYSGHGTGGHTFVCDGYNANNYYHFNFGWSGYSDGWYTTSAVNPGGMDFNSNQSAILGILPDSTGNVILGQMTGTSTFIVDEPLEFYHLLGHNAYEGTNYGNTCDNYVFFVSANNSNQLVADIIEFEDQNITINDGQGTWLKDLHGGSENDLSPVVSLNNALNIVYSGLWYYAGFKLIISQDEGCRMVSNIVASVDTTTVHLMWIENGSATQWQIEYGRAGFSHGDGTMVTLSSNNATISNLVSFTQYDFYIRSNCDDSRYGIWNQITLLIEAPYWQDIVTFQPEGYVLNEATNTAEISTAEGLAWWAKTDNTRDVLLNADIDLSGYKWRPVECHNFNGNGHIVSNAYIVENNSYVGFFSYLLGECKDLGLTDLYVKSSGGNTGGLCGQMGWSGLYYGSVTNCYVSNGTVIGTDYVGGMIGFAQESLITNCYSNVTVVGNRWSGLMVGKAEHQTIRNCYAAGDIALRSYCYYAGIAAYITTGEIDHCYSVELPMGVVGYSGSTIISDTSTFVRENDNWILHNPVSFDGVAETDLLNALNKGVEMMNDENLRVWTIDNANTNNGYPVFGNHYAVLCNNVDSLTAENIKVDNISAVVVKWRESIDAAQYQIRYAKNGLPLDSAVTVISYHSPDTLFGITLGYVYDISVRSLCDDSTHSAWTTIQAIIDLPYWTDVVVEQPSGYVEDEDGNVEISSAEGLAWLSVLCNGLHGQEARTFENKLITLTEDISLAGYRWRPIGENKRPDWRYFAGSFDGNNHSISDIHILDSRSYYGLFGLISGWEGSYIKNVNMIGGSISSIWGSSGDYEGYSTNQACIGGLAGSINHIDEVSNCHSSVTVFGLGAVGSLIGQAFIQNGSMNIYNCSATGVVYGRESCGGLIGECYGTITVKNSYATGDVRLSPGGINAWYRGGLIGNFQCNVSAFNCYATGFVEIENTLDYGKVIGSAYMNPHLHYIYGYADSNPGMGLFGGYCEDVSDTTQFHHNGNTNTLTTPIALNDETYTDLTNALNAWVSFMNDPKLLTWAIDSVTGYPIFSNTFEPSCYNPTELTISNATLMGDTIIRTELSWSQVGEPNHWEVLYVASRHSIDSGTIVSVYSNPCVLTNIPVGYPLDFYVRAICDTTDNSGWSSLVTYIPDKLRWTEIVTSQPEGYQEDADGRIYISSAEGLAWLSSVSNNLNGASNNLYNKNVFLTGNVDMSAYRWTPINSQYLYFDGMFHSINGIYCNELQRSVGFIGGAFGGVIKNVCISNCSIKGFTEAGGLAGYIKHTQISNCLVSGNISAIMSVGGFVGHSNYSSMINSCFVGNIEARSDIVYEDATRGYIGGFLSGSFQDTLINNYVVSEVPNELYSAIIIESAVSSVISNNYCKNYPTNIPLVPYDYTNISSFSGNGNTWTLNTPSYINGAFRTDLVDALNAWVDENNTDGQYFHWRTDTANINGGYPVFEVPPCLYVPRTFIEPSITACDSYTFNGVTYTESVSINDTLQTVNGCDSIVSQLILINHPVQSFENVNVCEGESYTFNGRTLTETNWYYDTIINGAANGCDSIVSLWLEVQNPTSWHNARICEGQSYTFNGRTLTETNWYYDTIINGATNGCDSIVSLWLEVQNNYSYPRAEICQGESYSFAGQMLTESGTYFDTLTNISANGCDSIVQLSFTVHPTNNQHDTVYLPANSLPYLYLYQDWTQEVDDFSVTMNSNTQIVDTRVNPSGTIYDNGGPNGNYSDYSDGTIILTADEGETIKLSGNYQLEGCCDYIAVYDGYGTSGNCLLYTCGGGSVNVQTSTGYLTIRFTSDGSVNYDGFALQWNTRHTIDTLLTATGDYSFEAHTSYGCDNTFNLHLEQRTAYSRTDSMTVCSNNLPYTYADTLIADAGTYTFAYLDRYGIDSTVTLHLTINHSTTGDTTVVACDSFTWWNTNYTNSTNDATHTLTNAAGCDSTVTLHLTVNNPVHTATTEVTCESYTWNGTAYAVSGDYAYSHLDNNGCTQVDTLHLTINNPVHTATTEMACETYTWNGTAYTVSGDYTYNHLDVNGCTQVDTLHLTINNPVHTVTTEAACETYTWNGTAYTVSGDYTYSHLDNNGCTQVDTLHLTINNPIHTVTTEVACETYTWNGTAYTVSGDYTYSHLDNNGCTQVDTLHLTINNPIHTVTTEVACETYTWNGTAYTVSGDYIYSHADNNGCTQVDTLHLTINNPIHTVTTEVACETYIWNGMAYTVSGDYTYSQLDNNGCTQVDTLHLTINNPVHTSTTEVACETYTWNGMAYTVSGDYTYSHADNNGCTQVDTLHLTVNHSTTGDTAAVACDSFTWWNTNYTNSTNEATHTLTNAAGCDSVVTLHLTINHSTTGVDVQTACDSYTWIDGNTYTESNFNSQFSILNSLGCDSTITLNLTINHSVTFYDTLTIGSNELPYDYYGNSIDGQGNFTFEGTTSEGCDSTTHLFVIVNQVGIGDVRTADGITLFPNPTRGTVTVSGNRLERVEVMDVVGRTLIVVVCQRASEIIDLSDLPQGAYVVRIIAENGTAVRRVVKR